VTGGQQGASAAGIEKDSGVAKRLGARLPSELHWYTAQAVAHELEGYQGGVSAGSWQGGELLQTEVQRCASGARKHEG
jgi:hypothetical protein